MQRNRPVHKPVRPLHPAQSITVAIERIQLLDRQRASVLSNRRIGIAVISEEIVCLTQR